MSMPSECENCGASLQGHYCHQCGQRAIDLRISIWSLCRDLFQEIFEVDGRMLRTFPALFLWPATLVGTFLSGRRQRFSSPVRIYLFSLLVAFFCFNYASSRGIEPYTQVLESRPVVVENGKLLFHFEAVDEAHGEVNLAIDVSGLSGGGQQLRKLEGMNQRQALRVVLGGVFDSAPSVVNLMIPMFAVLLKLIYRQTLFIDHLVLSIILHSSGLVVLGGAAVSGMAWCWAVALGFTLLHVVVAVWKIHGGKAIVFLGKALILIIGYGALALVGLGIVIMLAVMNL